MSKSSSDISEKMETYHGVVRTPTDAIKLFEACRLGLLPRVQRRLSEKERQSIRSGSVFVWDEREAGMRRWTDGKSWSASRVSGSFLTYREMEGKRGGFGGGRRGHGKTSDSDRGSDEDHDDGEPEGYRYKADGLMKQSFSIATSAGQSLHLISYYSRPQPGEPELLQPTTDPALRGIVPVRGMYPESSMGETNQTPALTRTPMQQTPYMVSSQHGGFHVPPQHQTPYAPQYAQSGYTPSGPSSKIRHGAYLEFESAHNLQAAAQAAIVDSRLSMPRIGSGQGPLPALNTVTNGVLSSHTGLHTPPTRTLSVTPPEPSHVDSHSTSGRTTNLSMILHPTPSSSESGNNGSAHSSPRAAGLSLPEQGGVSEDFRALRALDRKFCIKKEEDVMRKDTTSLSVWTIDF
ncbi:cAMP-independent regulatory protein pac2 [Escovopsis weberi]|uniref:cAMP-independent regulatory protein pac2 n=1 Tax=Escovopsis weberi TaxID=150374 RepID=A0A0M9VSJ4_ESCWE|nr:cAMP-independent regulatory protein pac2 [Escovopsis weberi]